MHLFRMYWMRTLKKPGAVYLWLLLPFVFMTIYTLTFGGDSKLTVGVAVMDRDSSFVSNFVRGAFERGPLEGLVEVFPVETLEDVKHLFSREKASAALVIPKGFGESVFLNESTTLTLYKNPRHFIGPQIAEGIIVILRDIGVSQIVFLYKNELFKAVADKGSGI